MSDKNRLQNLVWDGLFNGLANGQDESMVQAEQKKGKKPEKTNQSQPKSEENPADMPENSND